MLSPQTAILSPFPTTDTPNGVCATFYFLITLCILQNTCHIHYDIVFLGVINLVSWLSFETVKVDSNYGNWRTLHHHTDF